MNRALDDEVSSVDLPREEWLTLRWIVLRNSLLA